MPGSRASEIEHLGPIFAQVVMKLLASDSELEVVVPAASLERLEQIQHFMPIEDDRFSVIEGQSRLAMVASDSILCASGTTTLEAMLIGRPITIAYRMAWLSWQILSRMVTSPFVGLPISLQASLLYLSSCKARQQSITYTNRFLSRLALPVIRSACVLLS